MEPKFFGIEGVTDEDRAYQGSRFSEVRDAIFANPYQKVWGRAGEPPLPVYEVTTRSVLRGVLPFGAPYLFRKATERAVDSHADLRWGADRKGYRRLLHPNGICLTGLWEITEENPYSGYFKKGSRALAIGRYSTCCTETRRGHARSLALVGQLYQIAEIGKPKGEGTRAPEFQRFLVAPEQPRIEGEALDFRDEIMAQIFDKGDPKPKRTLTFNIEVTDEGTTRGLPVFQRRSFKNWRRIGRIVFDNAVVSYNGDFVIHFSHPTWRNDRNDSSTVARVNGRKVR